MMHIMEIYLPARAMARIPSTGLPLKDRGFAAILQSLDPRRASLSAHEAELQERPDRRHSAMMRPTKGGASRASLFSPPEGLPPDPPVIVRATVWATDEGR